MANLTGVLEEALQAVGELLEAEREEAAIVVVGGATMNLLGFVARATQDVDVIARARVPEGERPPVLMPPDPLPEALRRAVARVARDFRLPDDWMNTVVGKQWLQGLPPSLPEDLAWRRYGALHVGLVGRRTLIALKLFAAADQSVRSVHTQDLVALRPDAAELDEAARWVVSQDASPDFPGMVAHVVAHVLRVRDR